MAWSKWMKCAWPGVSGAASDRRAACPALPPGDRALQAPVRQLPIAPHVDMRDIVKGRLRRGKEIGRRLQRHHRRGHRDREGAELRRGARRIGHAKHQPRAGLGTRRHPRDRAARRIERQPRWQRSREQRKAVGQRAAAHHGCKAIGLADRGRRRRRTTEQQRLRRRQGHRLDAAPRHQLAMHQHRLRCVVADPEIVDVAAPLLERGEGLGFEIDLSGGAELHQRRLQVILCHGDGDRLPGRQIADPDPQRFAMKIRQPLAQPALRRLCLDDLHSA